MDQISRLQSDFDEVQRRLNDLSGGGGDGSDGSVPFDFQPIAVEAPRPPADQQLRNGDASHSVGSWFETVVAVNDKFREAAHWFTHNTPAASQALDLTTDARTSSVNNALKTTDHSQYSALYPDWDSTNGVARMTGTKSLDALLPSNPVFPGRTEYLGARIALRNSYIVAADDCHFSAMLYNNTTGSEDFMKASTVFTLSGSVRGGVPPTTTQRKYKVLAKTDRGYEFLSNEVDLPGAPSDAAFSTHDVGLSWERIDGVLSYEIFRFDVVAAKYRRLYTVTSGSNTYADNNHVDDDDVGGYPTASDDRVRCYVATLAGALSDLAVDGVDLEWDDLWLNIPVPTPLASAAAGNQVLRLALTKALDRRVTDAVVNNGSTNLDSATAAFSSLDTGRLVTVTDENGNTLATSISFVDADSVTLATAWPHANATGVTLYITGGGDHGLLIDMIHLSYIDRAKYSSWPEDKTRTLAPTAAPNTSGQGGVGGGGGGGGDPGDGGIGPGGCIPMDCPAWVYEGGRARSIPFGLARRGMAMVSGNLAPNHIRRIPPPTKTDNLHIVEFENGIWVPCSPGQPFFTSLTDRRGTAASRLREGDYAVTMRDGRLESSRIRAITATGQSAMVSIPVLTSSHSFVAGYLRLPWYEQLWRRVWPKDRGASGGILHNLKNDDLLRTF